MIKINDQTSYTGKEYRDALQICEPENVNNLIFPGEDEKTNLIRFKIVARKHLLEYLGWYIFKAKQISFFTDSGFINAKTIIMTAYQTNLITKDEYWNLHDFIDNEKEKIKKSK